MPALAIRKDLAHPWRVPDEEAAAIQSRLAAEVVLNYITLRTYQHRLVIARDACQAQATISRNVLGRELRAARRQRR